MKRFELDIKLVDFVAVVTLVKMIAEIVTWVRGRFGAGLCQNDTSTEIRSDQTAS